MVRKYRDYPEEGELVVGKVTKINPYSGFIYLEEYDKTGMVHISEVARKWVRDIREFLKEGRQVVALVMKVDEKSGHISLSLKRVSKREAEEKLKEFKREQKAEKMLELISKETGMSMDEAYEKIGFPFQKIFGEMYEGFKISLTQPEVLERKGIEKKIVEIVRKTAEKSIEIKETEVKAEIEIRTLDPNGIEIIKKYLRELEKNGFKVSYISAPRYMVWTTSKDPKKAENRLMEVCEKTAKSYGLEFAFKRLR
ncbi:MAG: S1 RNA-binding domain-containing protein [Candidatus Micrarchaeota archaeon]|nr:S1 RNA-binding domain-containing protein [Candidatus Micrarchaeota archaeon]